MQNLKRMVRQKHDGPVKCRYPSLKKHSSKVEMQWIHCPSRRGKLQSLQAHALELMVALLEVLRVLHSTHHFQQPFQKEVIAQRCRRQLDP